MIYHLYTDGACQPNPGKGGWSYILFDVNRPQERIIAQGNNPNSTNNQMELQAVVEGMKKFVSLQDQSRHNQLIIYSDSKYLVNGINSWVNGWEKNNWIKKDNKPVLNKEIWQQIFDLKKQIHPTAIHVDGHAGNVINEEVDKLAVSAINK